MADTIENYGDLKAAIGRYLNRTNQDFTAEIPTFIQFCERKIFRILRCPANETENIWPASDTEDYSTLAVPTDYLEAKLFYVNGMPLQRISDIHMLALLKDSAVGFPQHFARIANKFYFWPKPEAAYETRMVYYQDYSGRLTEEADTHEFLRLMPDAYLYGACLEAEPWLKNDERIQTWSALWKAVVNGMNEQAAEAEYSGSNVTVSSGVNNVSGGYG